MKNKYLPLLGLLPLCMLFSYSISFNQSSDKSVNKTKLQEVNKDFKGESLTIYNCQDYIDEELISEFEEAYNCHVNYYTYDTNETMYNQFTLQPEGTYDLICTSDYMIQRMVREQLVIPLNIKEDCPLYDEYASKPIRGKLQDMYADTNGDGIKDTSLDEYAAGYMWGTLGIIYDPNCSPTIQEDVRSWNVFWDENYKSLISIKNSMRDTFVVGLMHAYSGSPYSDVEDIALQAREAFLKEMEEASTQEDIDNARNKYNKVIQNLFDLVITQDNPTEVINLVKNELISLKKNIFGFEVDSGKNDIITGKIKMNLAWSGDAVYSIDCALEQQDKVLEYYVPEEGSNVWYDAWTMPKGANEELATLFIDFLSDPVNAQRNMEYIGYTSFIACDEVFDLVSSWYGISPFFEGSEYYGPYYDEESEEEVEGSIVMYNDKFYQCIADSCGNLPTDSNYFEEIEIDEEDLAKPYDLSHIFGENISEGKSPIIYPYVDSENQLMCQYPDQDTLARCAVMNDFEEANEQVVIMWGQVKAYTNMLPYYLVLGATLTICIGFVSYHLIKKKKSMRNKRKLESLTK
ncbi:MAG: extracellular solute-binding protein [Bacillales bacterium]|nr:extracellular solute-binding protein [Bacillales bacterium]